MRRATHAIIMKRAKNPTLRALEAMATRAKKIYFESE